MTSKYSYNNKIKCTREQRRKYFTSSGDKSIISESLKTDPAIIIEKVAEAEPLPSDVKDVEDEETSKDVVFAATELEEQADISNDKPTKIYQRLLSTSDRI